MHTTFSGMSQLEICHCQITFLQHTQSKRKLSDLTELHDWGGENLVIYLLVCDHDKFLAKPKKKKKSKYIDKKEDKSTYSCLKSSKGNGCGKGETQRNGQTGPSELMLVISRKPQDDWQFSSALVHSTTHASFPSTMWDKMPLWCKINKPAQHTVKRQAGIPNERHAGSFDPPSLS